MASAIDATKPVAGSPTTQSVRDNFATAAAEITALQTAPNQTITLSGDIAGSGTAAITTTLPIVNGNVGTFQGLTVNAKGQVTAASNQSYVTGGPYVAIAGGAMTGNLTAPNLGVNASATVGCRVLVSGAGQGTAAVNTAGALTNAVMLDDSAAGAGNGGTILFSAAAQTWRFASMQGFATNGASNSQGHVSISTRRAATDAALTETARFQADGICMNTSGSWTTISDASVKSRVQPYERGLAAILALQPVSFVYNENAPFADGTTRYGLVAQDVEPHVPEAVGKLAAPPLDKDAVELSTLDPTHMVYVLINAVQELQAEIDALTADARER